MYSACMYNVKVLITSKNLINQSVSQSVNRLTIN